MVVSIILVLYILNCPVSWQSFYGLYNGYLYITLRKEGSWHYPVPQHYFRLSKRKATSPSTNKLHSLQYPQSIALDSSPTSKLVITGSSRKKVSWICTIHLKICYSRKFFILNYMIHYNSTVLNSGAYSGLPLNCSFSRTFI